MTESTSTSTPALTDVHDMVVVHRTFRRELTLLPPLVRAVGAGDTARAAVLARHARFVLAGLHVHHTGEDELLWPLLRERAAPSTALVERMQTQHHTVETLVDGLGPALDRWEVEARPAVATEVADLLDALRVALVEHLDEEEAEILPLAARHVSPAEWAAVGEHGASQIPTALLPVMFGMLLEDSTPDERAHMFGVVPLPARLLLRTWGRWSYRRYITAVRGAPAGR